MLAEGWKVPLTVAGAGEIELSSIHRFVFQVKNECHDTLVTAVDEYLYSCRYLLVRLPIRSPIRTSTRRTYPMCITIPDPTHIRIIGMLQGVSFPIAMALASAANLSWGLG